MPVAPALLARVALSLHCEPGGGVLADVRELGPEAVLADQPQAAGWALQAARVIERCRARSIDLVSPGTVSWPTQLDDLAVPPAILYTLGAPLRPAALRSVAIVGSRTASADGQRIAHNWAAALAADGFTIVSGAAFGIDAAAHRGALSVAGATIAVLAGGPDVPSPRAHAQLLASIEQRGTMVSELPPGTAPARHRFLVRNRLIAALTPATLVVQAATRSGALSTARQAADLRRIVLAVPGAVGDPVHAGCHDLIRERVAELVAGPAEVAELLNPLAGLTPQGSSTAW